MYNIEKGNKISSKQLLLSMIIKRYFSNKGEVLVYNTVINFLFCLLVFLTLVQELYPCT